MSGRATTEKIDAVLGDLDRVDPGHRRSPPPSTRKSEPGGGEARCFLRAAVAPPLPAEELGEVVGGGEAGVDRGAADAEEHPAEGEQEAGLAEGVLDRQGDRAEVGGFDAERVEEVAGDDDQGDRQGRRRARSRRSRSVGSLSGSSRSTPPRSPPRSRSGPRRASAPPRRRRRRSRGRAWSR